MAEARTDEEEENMRESREQVVRRQPNSSAGRAERRKPEHRHSQGPLSSIRAVIKRTSARSTSLSETPREPERERERERDRHRDRRRPEITILSAEPLAPGSWFPGASGGFPPPPPPAAQIWGSSIPPAVQPPPSYEEVIREKTQEQVPLPTVQQASSAASVSTTTIATQTDLANAAEPQNTHERRPVRPPRPPLPTSTPKPTDVADISLATSRPIPTSYHSEGLNPETNTHTSAITQCCDLVAENFSPLTSTSAAQTDTLEPSLTAPPAPSPRVCFERPRPRPRSKFNAQPVSCEVKVQTLVKLREDGLATIAARSRSDAPIKVTQGKYSQELLEAFSSDDWGFPEHYSDSGGLSQSEGEDDTEELDEEEMATLKARIQAFEQQQTPANESGCAVDGISEEAAVANRPEPQPRPRVLGQVAKVPPPTVAPKPKTFPQVPKPSNKCFWEDGGLTADASSIDTSKKSEAPSIISNPPPQNTAEPPCLPNPVLASTLPPSKNTQKPLVTAPKPPPGLETPQTTSPVSVPKPAPRPPPPKGETPSPVNPRPPPRPPVAPRASVAVPPRDKSSTCSNAASALTRTSSVDVFSTGSTQSTTETELQDTSEPSAKASGRPAIPTKPAALTRDSRRASAPALVSKPTRVSPTPQDHSPALLKPLGPTPSPGLRPQALTQAPAPALRKVTTAQAKSETSTTNTTSPDPPLPPRPPPLLSRLSASGEKLLPLRPPPIKSTPIRPPPPAVGASSPPEPCEAARPHQSDHSSTLLTSAKPNPALQTGPSPIPTRANQTEDQRPLKKGPPLPPRPKPRHPADADVKHEVLIVLDDPNPSESTFSVEKAQTTINPVKETPSPLDLDMPPEPVLGLENLLKPRQEDTDQSESQSILPSEQKEQPDPAPIRGPRCVALFDYEGEEEDELTFSQGDVIGLLEMAGQDWGRGQIHKRVGIFPLSFTKVVEPLPQLPVSPEDRTTATPTETEVLKSSQEHNTEAEEWVVALFNFPGQTAEDLSFQRGALIRVTEHVDAEWRRGRLEGQEGLFPAAFTQPCQDKIAAKAVFDFTAENEDELTLKIGDIVTQVEFVDEQWIMGVVGGKRGIVPKNYISLL